MQLTRRLERPFVSVVDEYDEGIEVLKHGILPFFCGDIPDRLDVVIILPNNLFIAIVILIITLVPYVLDGDLIEELIEFEAPSVRIFWPVRVLLFDHQRVICNQLLHLDLPPLRVGLLWGVFDIVEHFPDLSPHLLSLLFVHEIRTVVIVLNVVAAAAGAGWFLGSCDYLYMGSYLLCRSKSKRGGGFG